MCANATFAISNNCRYSFVQINAEPLWKLCFWLDWTWTIEAIHIKSNQMEWNRKVDTRTVSMPIKKNWYYFRSDWSKLTYARKPTQTQIKIDRQTQNMNWIRMWIHRYLFFFFCIPWRQFRYLFLLTSHFICLPILSYANTHMKRFLSFNSRFIRRITCVPNAKQFDKVHFAHIKRWISHCIFIFSLVYFRHMF